MSLLKRIGYYLGGFSIGLVLLAFFLNGKKASCSYGPSSRVKKNIRIKKQVHSNEVSNLISSKIIDTATINYLLNKGTVNFSESNTNLDSCNIYIVEGSYNSQNIKLTIENCDSLATIQKVDIKK